MSDKSESPEELYVIDENWSRGVLEQQIEIYRSLLRQAQMTLRLIIALIGVIIASLSLLLSGIFNDVIAIQTRESYLQTTADLSNLPAEVLFWVSTGLLASGSAVILFGSLIGLKGGLDIFSVTSTRSLKPFLSDTGAPNYYVIDKKTISEINVIEAYLNKNGNILNSMRSDLSRGTQKLIISGFFIFFGLVSVYSAYFGELLLMGPLILAGYLAPAIYSSIYIYLTKRGNDSTEVTESVNKIGSMLDVLLLLMFGMVVILFSWGGFVGSMYAFIEYRFGNMLNVFIWFTILLIAMVAASAGLYLQSR